MKQERTCTASPRQSQDYFESRTENFVFQLFVLTGENFPILSFSRFSRVSETPICLYFQCMRQNLFYLKQDIGFFF